MFLAAPVRVADLVRDTLSRLVHTKQELQEIKIASPERTKCPVESGMRRCNCVLKLAGGAPNDRRSFLRRFHWRSIHRLIDIRSVKRRMR